MRTLSVVIPVYNAELSLEDLHRELNTRLGELGGRFEIIFVDDGSRDRSWEIIQSLCAVDARVRGIRLSRNFGQHNALLCGIRAADCEVIVTMDDDLQNPPEEIPKLLEKLEEGYDVVYGANERGQHGTWRNAASWVTKLALKNAMGVRGAGSVSAFRAFRTGLRDHFADYQSPSVAVDVLLSWATTRFASVPVRFDRREKGISGYTFWKLVNHAINMMTGYSTLPLKIASLTGFLLTLFGVGVLAYVVGRYIIEGGSVPGFPFLASVIAIFSGAQLFAMGIFGEYLTRIHFRTMGRPIYVVDARTESDLDGAKRKGKMESHDG